MRVELVGVAKSDGVAITGLPAVVGRDGGADSERGDPPQGSYYCLISQVDDQLIVWDLGSRGGTFVNGSRVTKATLRASDTLRLGGKEFSVRCQPAPSRYLYGLRC
jgi:predicted component of type VI protein secretion system